MATAGEGGGDGWERIQGRKDQRHCRIAEAVKESYEEVEARGHRDLAYGHWVSHLQVNIAIRSLCRALSLFVMMSTMISSSGVVEQVS